MRPLWKRRAQTPWLPGTFSYVLSGCRLCQAWWMCVERELQTPAIYRSIISRFSRKRPVSERNGRIWRGPRPLVQRRKNRWSTLRFDIKRMENVDPNRIWNGWKYYWSLRRIFWRKTENAFLFGDLLQKDRWANDSRIQKPHDPFLTDKWRSTFF